jgi:hypothetical protein
MENKTPTGVVGIMFFEMPTLHRGKLLCCKVPSKLHYKSLLGALWIDKSFWLVTEGTFVHFLPTPNDHKRNGVEACIRY